MRRKRKAKKGFPFWGIVALSFAIGFVIALVAFNYLGVVGGPNRLLARFAPEVTRPPLPAPPELRPRIAIVIDDMGRDLNGLRKILLMDAPITVAVLPHLRFSRRVALEASSRGRDVLLHLPMEPKDTVHNNPGRGALLTGMDAGAIKKIVEEDLRDVPNAVGVNNHMGSKFTEDEALMRQVLDLVKDKGLFFLDSRTTPRTVALRMAREMGVRNADRNIFLDNNRDTLYIKGQLDRLVKIARDRGKAVAIGHPYPETLAVLKENISTLKDGGVDIVRLSELLE